MSLYAEYIFEREGMKTIEDERGFATYLLDLQADKCYVRDVFVKPEFRIEGVASQYLRQIEEEISQDNVKQLITSVCIGTNGCEVSVNAIIAYGFKFSHTNGEMIYFSKELR